MLLLTLTFLSIYLSLFLSIYLCYFTGSITISLQSTSSSSFSTRITPVGHLIKRNESVTITCQTVAHETSSNITWSKRTFGNDSTLSGNSILSWNEDEYLFGSLTLDRFNYSHCGVYSCRININELPQEIEIPLSIEGTVPESDIKVKVKSVRCIFSAHEKVKLESNKLVSNEKLCYARNKLDLHFKHLTIIKRSKNEVHLVLGWKLDFMHF